MKTVSHIMAIIALFLSVQLSAQTKRALVIGLGKQEDNSWAKINGDKDVPYVQAMLKKAGYKDFDIITLSNSKATKAGIVNAFDNLTKKCKTGDIIYIHFSGHGQLVTDLDGDEDDGWDEAWIPYDAYLKFGEHDNGEKHLIDDEIHVLLTRIKEKIGNDGEMLVVVDACFSGDSTRGEDIEETVRGVFDEFVIPSVPKNDKAKRNKANGKQEQWLTLSACTDYQLNQEMKNPQVGKLTYALFSLSENGTVTWKSVQKFMHRNRSELPQTPVLTPKTKMDNLSIIIK